MSRINPNLNMSSTKLFTCFCGTDYKTHESVLTCVENTGTREAHKQVVRQFMHPTDDIGWTLWIFGAFQKQLKYDTSKSQQWNEERWRQELKQMKTCFREPKIVFEKLD